MDGQTDGWMDGQGWGMDEQKMGTCVGKQGDERIVGRWMHG